jgi:invasion protein IalB
MMLNGLLTMPISLKPLPLLALFAWAAPIAAQETTEPPSEGTVAAPQDDLPETTPTEVDPAADGGTEAPADTTPGLDMGEPIEGAAAEPQVGQPYVREEFGDWSLRCLRTESDADPCQLYQLLLDEEGNAVAEISLFPLPEGAQAVAGAEIVAPLLTLLTEELTLSVDGSAARRYPFSYCNPAGCVARLGFTAEEVEQFRRGVTGQLSIVPALAPEETVTLDISLSGFTAGYEATQASLAAVQAAAEQEGVAEPAEATEPTEAAPAE